MHQPWDAEVGAGTMHPEAFLRVIGPKLWRVAYVQPSCRPTDGRYGQNPNRLWEAREDCEGLAAAFKRARNILGDAATVAVEPAQDRDRCAG